MKQAVQLTVISAANICVGFLFQWFVLTRLGPGVETDALFAGMTLPQLVLSVISGSLMHVLVPLLAGENEKRLHHDAWGFFILVGILFGALSLILYLAAPWWIPFTVPGFSDGAQALTTHLTRIQLIGMVFAALNGVQWATYHARQQFIWAEFTPVVSSIFSLLLLVWALPRFGVVAAAWIGTFRMALQTLLLSPGMGRPIWPDLKTPAIRAAWKRIKPLLLGTTYYKTDPLIDRFLLSTANSGTLSLYYFAQQIYGAANQVINKAIAAPLVPLLSKLHKAADIDGFRRAYHQKLFVMGGLSILGVSLVGLLGQEALDLLIGHGNVNAHNVKGLWWIMIWLSGVFVGGAVGQICSSSFYACGDTRSPTTISIITFTFYVPIKIVAYKKYSVEGLAIATSAYYLLDFLWLFLYKKQIFDRNLNKRVSNEN